jgi:DNA replication protein DnaC/catechol 2,3-dioxygenase-like lactoylglutathione lyase family enzyme
MIAADHDLDALFKRLHLANARRVWRDLVHRAEREAWTYRDFLTLLVTEEIAHRQQTRLGRLTRRAHFPFLKTIDDFNFTYQSSLRLHMLGSALTPDFVTEGRSLIFLGKPGRGKTHLAVAMAYRAIQNGFDAFFTTAATLIDDLSAAFRDGQLAQALQTYTHPAVLVVDEVGYLTYGTDAANMLFHVVNERHRRHRAMIFTTNKALKAWGRVLHDEDLGQAIIDRVLERGRLIRLDGPSIRTLHLKLDEPLKDESDQEDEVARISGIKWPEFPEPTVADVQASAEFYRDSLGFSIDFLHGDPPFYGSVSRDGACVHLKFVHEPVFTLGPQDRNGFIMVFVEVDNVKALFAEYVAAGVTFTQRLQKEAWGGHDFIVRDPDGNMICFAGRSTIG